MLNSLFEVFYTKKGYFSSSLEKCPLKYPLKTQNKSNVPNLGIQEELQEINFA